MESKTCDECGRVLKRSGFATHKVSHRNRATDYIVDSNGCWVWQKATSGKFAKKGRPYGQLWWWGKAVMAHRYYYEKLKGKIPEGLTLDHLCLNTMCVNPDHLEPVTSGENTRRYHRQRMEAKGE